MSEERKCPEGWKPWMKSKGCDVLTDRKPGDMHARHRPGDRYVECRRCRRLIYDKDMGVTYNVDDPPDACPKCGAEE